MKIQKHISHKRGDKTYHKHVIVLPQETLKKAGLKAGDELVVKEVKKGEFKVVKTGLK